METRKTKLKANINDILIHERVNSGETREDTLAEALNGEKPKANSDVSLTNMRERFRIQSERFRGRIRAKSRELYYDPMKNRYVVDEN